MNKAKAKALFDEMHAIADDAGVPILNLTRRVWEDNAKTKPQRYRRLGSWAKVRRLAAQSRGHRGDELDPVWSQQVTDELTYARRIERQKSRESYRSEMFYAKLGDLFEKNPQASKGKDKRKRKAIDKTPSTRTLVALISDTHLGLMVDGEEVPANPFGWLQASRRFAKIANELATWKPTHRAETDLRIVLAGDIIQGAIHIEGELGAEAMAMQCWGASQILIRFVDYLRQHFPRIRIACTPGNHDRYTHRGKGRAVAGKWDGFATSIYQTVMVAFRDSDDVTFQIPKTPYAVFEEQGHTVFATHGDTVMTTGNLGKSISVDKIMAQIYAVDASGVLPAKIDVTLAGHVHVPAFTVLNNGSRLVVNGTLSGTDPFAQSIGFHASHPSQQIFEMSPAYSVGDCRTVMLADADAVAEFDDIIQPISTQLDAKISR